MDNTKKLYRVTLRGMTYNSTGMIRGISYVVATNPDEAFKKVKSFLDTNHYGFKHERELDKIELIAEDYIYTDTKTMLFM